VFDSCSGMSNDTGHASVSKGVTVPSARVLEPLCETTNAGLCALSARIEEAKSYYLKNKRLKRQIPHFLQPLISSYCVTAL
jgi:hypothetical protein